jgi:hypothetical protein
MLSDKIRPMISYYHDKTSIVLYKIGSLLYQIEQFNLNQ